jgi:pyruvate,water dikinase
MSNGLVLPLGSSDDVKLVGGKAASLAKLTRGGFNVPPGFVVSTKSGMEMTTGLETEILRSFDNLRLDKVAVRSSAVAEDSGSAAWAGQFDTFLNTSQADLIENIEKCWASAESDRAETYAHEKGLETGAVAVIVQSMIPADSAGVAFSVNPVTNDKNQIVIEAAIGLGEQLVSGQITPDDYLVHKGSWNITGKSFTTKNVVLNDPQITKIAKETAKIEELFGFPVDVEWALAADKLFILQSRPITTLG